MNGVMSGIIGISLGIAIIISIQAACYKFIAWEDYPKAVIIALSSVIIGILAAIIIMKVAG